MFCPFLRTFRIAKEDNAFFRHRKILEVLFSTMRMQQKRFLLLLLIKNCALCRVCVGRRRTFSDVVKIMATGRKAWFFTFRYIPNERILLYTNELGKCSRGSVEV